MFLRQMLKLLLLLAVLFVSTQAMPLDYNEPEEGMVVFERSERSLPEFGRLKLFWAKNHVSYLVVNLV